MKLKNIITTGIIIWTWIGACKQSDHPLTAKDYKILDSIHRRDDSLMLAQQNKKLQEKIKNTFVLPLHTPEQWVSSIDSSQDSTTWYTRSKSQNPITIGLTDTLSQNVPIKEEKIVSPLIQDHTITPSSENKIIEDTKPKAETTSFNSEKERKDALDIIIKPSSDVKFDEKFIKWRISQIFAQHFIIEKNNISFIPPTPDQEYQIRNDMEQIRAHIKQRSGIWVKLLLTKWKLKDYIAEQIWIAYKALVLDNHLSYKGWSTQFQADVETIIDIYK